MRNADLMLSRRKGGACTVFLGSVTEKTCSRDRNVGPST